MSQPRDRSSSEFLEVQKCWELARAASFPPYRLSLRGETVMVDHQDDWGSFVWLATEDEVRQASALLMEHSA